MHIEEIGKSVSFHLKNIAFSRFEHSSEYNNIISPFSRLYLITDGEGYLIFNGEKIILEPNHLYLIPSFTPCSYFFEKNLAHIYIHFSIDMPSGLNIYSVFSVLTKIMAESEVPALFYKLFNLNPGYEIPHHDPKVYQTKPWINKEVSYSSLAHYLETTGIIAQLFSHFVKEALPGNIRKIANQNFQKVLRFIHENLDHEISVRQLASMSFFSKDHFSRVFKSITGISPKEYIILKRLEKAKLLLLTTNFRLNEIIQHSGFTSTPYFCRMFKKYTEFTPEEFRKKRG